MNDDASSQHVTLLRLTSLAQKNGFSISEKVTGFAVLIRPINCVIAGFAVIVGEVVALRGYLKIELAVLGFLVAFLLLGATMAMNDVYDIEVDRINSPHRPIPSGRVSRLGASLLALVFVVGGGLLAFLINYPSSVIAALAIALMMYYNVHGKRTGFLGNAIVSTCISLPFVFGGTAVNNLQPVSWLFASLAFTSNMGREIAKGIIDLVGDKSQNIRTIAVLWGPNAAAKAAAFFLILAVGLSLAPLLLDLVSFHYVFFLIPSDIGFLWTALSILKDHDQLKVAGLKNKILIFMTLGLFAFLAGVLQ